MKVIGVIIQSRYIKLPPYNQHIQGPSVADTVIRLEATEVQDDDPDETEGSDDENVVEEPDNVLGLSRYLTRLGQMQKEERGEGERGEERSALIVKVRLDEMRKERDFFVG